VQTALEELIAERDKVVAHWRAQATHRGEYKGIPPTGNRVNFTGISIYRIEGGQIAESWGVSDLLGMMQQLGTVPSPGQGES
jgi:predicted ester cyclase